MGNVTTIEGWGTTGMTFIVAEDEALKNYLRNIMVSDEKNASREVGVWFSIPDVETRQQSYPYMTIELMDVERAAYRQHSGRLVDTDLQGTEPPQPGIVYNYSMPIPWDLTYQITSYARHPRHDRQIINYLLSNTFTGQQGFLQVSNELGTESSYRHLTLEGFTKRDMVEDGRRLFRNVFTIRITSETVAGGGQGVREVSDVLINYDPENIPDEFTIL